MLLVFELFALLLFCHPRSACEETIKMSTHVLIVNKLMC
jgi:hypothetical protein